MPDSSATPLPPNWLLPALMALASMGFMSFNAVIGLIARELGLSEVQVGLLVTIGGLVLMVTSARSGRLSDRIGRAPVLRFGFGLYTIAFALTALFLWWALGGSSAPPAAPLRAASMIFGALLLLRIFVAVSYGAITTVCQALTADSTNAANRGRAMAALGLGQAAGMVLGPGLASISAAWSLVAPVVLATLLGAIGCSLAIRRVPGARPAAAEAPSQANLFDARMRFALLSGFCAMFCVMSVQIVTGFFIQDRFGLNTRSAAAMAGAALTAVGLALICAQIAQRRFNWPPRRLMLTGAPIAALGFSVALFVQTPWQLLSGYFIAGFGMGYIFPAVQVASANAVAAHEQGAAAGTLGAAQALGMVVAPLLAGLLYRSIGPTAPYLLSVALVGLIAILAFKQPAAASIAANLSGVKVSNAKDVFQPVDTQSIDRARQLIDQAAFGSLAVLEAETGHPLASRVAIALDADRTPIMLMSALAAHVPALAKDNRCSLLLGEPGSGDPLAHPRITLIGRARRLDRDSADHQRARDRYLARHPKAKLYADFGDFSFYRLEIERAALNAGFSKAYRFENAQQLQGDSGV